MYTMGRDGGRPSPRSIYFRNSDVFSVVRRHYRDIIVYIETIQYNIIFNIRFDKYT